MMIHLPPPSPSDSFQIDKLNDYIRFILNKILRGAKRAFGRESAGLRTTRELVHTAEDSENCAKAIRGRIKRNDPLAADIHSFRYANPGSKTPQGHLKG